MENIEKVVGEITTEGLPISYVKLMGRLKEITLQHIRLTGNAPLFNIEGINQLIHEIAEENA